MNALCKFLSLFQEHHKYVQVNHLYTTGATFCKNEKREVPIKVTLFVCTECEKLKGTIETPCGEKTDYYGEDLKILMATTGLKWKPLPITDKNKPCVSENLVE